MKPYDIKGEYTPEEVEAALTGINGTRQLSRRYELLNEDNVFISELDNIQSCSIDYNVHADIKRTAQFEILDTGTINYLKDRIKPYVRVEMPKDETYGDLVQSYDPSAWYRFDDPTQTELIGAGETIASNMTHNTYATAYVAKEGYRVYPAMGASGSTTVRPTMWIKIAVTDSNPINLSVYVNTPGAYTIQAYVQNGTAESDLVQIPGLTSGIFSVYSTYPTRTTYYVKLSGLAQAGTVGIEWDRPSRISDTSGNNRHMATANAAMRQTPVVLDGGKSIKRGDYLFAGKVDTPASTKYAGMGWFRNVTGVTELAFACYGNFNNEFDSAERSTRRANVEVRIDYTLRRVRIYGGFKNYATEIYWDVMIPANVNMTAWKNIAWSVDFAAQKPRLWIDGAEITYIPSTPTSFYGVITDVVNPLTNYIDVSSNSGGELYVDDTFFLFGTLLDSYDVQNLYAKGSVEYDSRSGFCEWPLGVFLLTSPTRTMEDGNVITRSVDGYDQLSALKEDAFAYRYSVEAGAKYTDAIQSVLQTNVPTKSYPMIDPMWSSPSATPVTVVSGTSIVIPGATNSDPHYKSAADALNLNGLTVSFKADFGPDNPYLVARLYYKEGLEDKQAYIARVGANILFYADGVTDTYVYNASTMAYWRIREQDGDIIMECSSNNQTWVTYKTATRGTLLATTVVVEFSNQSRVSTSLTTLTHVSITGNRILTNAVVKSTTILPSGMEWEPGTPKLTIINDLLGAINYESAYYDEDGVFNGRPYISPQSRGSEFTYATNYKSVILGDVDQTVDIFGIPNVFILTVSDPDRPAITGTYINSDPLSPTSTVSRGRQIVDFRTEQNAADQFTLDAQAARLAFEASQVYEVIEFETALMPIHGHGDVYNLVIDGLKVSNKYSEQSWSMDLENGSTMSHRVRRVIAI